MDNDNFALINIILFRTIKPSLLWPNTLKRCYKNPRRILTGNMRSSTLPTISIIRNNRMIKDLLRAVTRCHYPMGVFRLLHTPPMEMDIIQKSVTRVKLRAHNLKPTPLHLFNSKSRIDYNRCREAVLWCILRKNRSRNRSK